MKLKKILSKYQGYLLAIAITLSAIAISIRSRDGKVTLILQEYPILIFFMVVMSSFLVVLYVQIHKRKITTLSKQIKNQSETNGEETKMLLKNLTVRQTEVHELILSGKTNKEIMAELYIEKSTLKSHINQIYRKLHIKSRKELKSNLDS